MMQRGVYVMMQREVYVMMQRGVYVMMKELGVKSTRGWCNKVKDKGWLASKLGKSKKKGKGKKKD